MDGGEGKQVSGQCSVLELEEKMFQWPCYIMEKYICNGNYRYQVDILQMTSKKTEPVEKCKNDMNRQVTKGQILMASKPMKRC